MLLVILLLLLLLAFAGGITLHGLAWLLVLFAVVAILVALASGSRL